MSVIGDAKLLIDDVLRSMNFDESMKPTECDVTTDEYIISQLLFLSDLLDGKDVENLSLLELKATQLKKERAKINRRINVILGEETCDD